MLTLASVIGNVTLVLGEFEKILFPSIKIAIEHASKYLLVLGDDTLDSVRSRAPIESVGVAKEHKL